MTNEESEVLISENDREYLQEKEYVFDVARVDPNIHLVIRDFDLPEAYTPRTADLLIILPAGYPNAALDMFWTCPDVKLANGNWPNRCESHQEYSGRNWQRWSRHFPNPWRAGVDNIRTFLTVVRREIAKGI